MSGKLDFTKCLANPEWRIACIVWNALPLSYKIRFRIVCFQKDRIRNRFHGKPHYNLFLTNFWSVTINQIYSNEKHCRHIFLLGRILLPTISYLCHVSMPLGKNLSQENQLKSCPFRCLIRHKSTLLLILCP